MIKQYFLAVILFFASIYNICAQTIREFVIERIYEETVAVYSVSCNSPAHGVLVFRTALADMQISMYPPSRLYNINHNAPRNEYVLCVEPTDARYRISINHSEFEGIDFFVENVIASQAQIFRVNPKDADYVSKIKELEARLAIFEERERASNTSATPANNSATAEQGDAEAQYRLGLQYRENNRLQEAEHWYRKAAEQGHANAQNRLGNFYAIGEGGVVDLTQAVYWYRKAAEQGHADAQFNLGWRYNQGLGVAQDFTQAVYWYRKAAEQGNDFAQNNLGTSYADGEGVAQNYTQAIYWYRKAAEQGNYLAQDNLGLNYELGRGVSQDFTQAVYWYRKAAEQGHANAQNNMALAYLQGQGVAQDYTQAVFWLRKAAEQGNANAQNNLAICYLQGFGVERDLDKALYWYESSIKNGLSGENKTKAENIIKALKSQ